MQRTKKLHLFQLLGRDIIWCTLSFNLGTTLHAFFISSTYLSNATLKLTKNQAKAKQHPEAELLLFEDYSHSSSENNRTYSRK